MGTLALADAFDRSELRELVPGLSSASGVDHALVRGGKVRVGWLSKFWTLLCRTFIIKARDPMVLATQLGTAVFMGLIFGGVYFDSYGKPEIEFAILDTQMCITMTVVMVMWLPFDVVLTFPKERQIFLRERKAGLYPTTAYYLARILADVPMHVVAATIMASMIYPMAQLRMGIHYFILVNVLGVLVGAAVMQAIGAICRSFEEANMLMMPVMMLAMMTSTTFVRQVPGWLGWMKEVSMMGLLADLAMYLEFRDFDTADFAWQYAWPDQSGREQVLDKYAVSIKTSQDAVNAVLVLVAILGVARLITFLAVKFMHTGRSSCAENLAD